MRRLASGHRDGARARHTGDGALSGYYESALGSAFGEFSAKIADDGRTFSGECVPDDGSGPQLMLFWAAARGAIAQRAPPQGTSPHPRCAVLLASDRPLPFERLRSHIVRLGCAVVRSEGAPPQHGELLRAVWRADAHDAPAGSWSPVTNA